MMAIKKKPLLTNADHDKAKPLLRLGLTKEYRPQPDNVLEIRIEGLHSDKISNIDSVTILI